MPQAFEVVQLIVMLITILSVVGSAIWGVATMQQITMQLRKSVTELTESVNKLADRIDDIEHEHSLTRERIARLEGRKQQP